MTTRGLIDTGALLALLDRDDRWHRATKDALGETALPLATTSAVLCELFHLLRGQPRTARAAWSLLRSGAFVLATIRDDELDDIAKLMEKYEDRPMDFADATLVHVAGRESVGIILTVDHDDFETYRYAGRRRFSIAPARDAAD